MKHFEDPVSQAMETEVVTLQRDDRLDLAEDIMRLGRIRHIPVLEGERVVGILTNRDLLSASLSHALEFDPSERRAFIRSVEVKEVMTATVETVPPHASLRDAGRTMLRLRIGCLPVVDDAGVFLGMLTETDLLRAALEVDEEEDAIVVSESNEGGEEMSEAKGRFDDELDELRRVRDELRVQANLGKAEATELWEKLEHRFEELEGKVKAKAKAAGEPLADIGDAAQMLADEIRNGYRRLRDIL